MVAWTPSRYLTEQLASRGYIHTRRFIAFPSQSRARWLLPQGNCNGTLSGLEIYTPYAPAARVLKAVLRLALKMGLPDWAGQRVLVASRDSLPLEVLVAEITGERHPIFALSLGTPTRFRKLTIQVMASNGEILGYIKLPLTEAAGERVRHEAQMLGRLSDCAALRARIPRVLHAGEWENGYILFQSSAPVSPGPIEFNELYGDFLRVLWNIHPTEKPGNVLLKEVACLWQAAEPQLNSRWRALGEASLTLAKRELIGIMIPCGVSHGDFAPWNARVANGQLSVFDWESASWDAPAAWDIYHFKTQVAALGNKKNSLPEFRNRSSGERASFLLYLLNSVRQLIDEETPSGGVGLECRRQLIEKQLEEC